MKYCQEMMKHREEYERMMKYSQYNQYCNSNLNQYVRNMHHEVPGLNPITGMMGGNSHSGSGEYQIIRQRHESICTKVFPMDMNLRNPENSGVITNKISVIKYPNIDECLDQTISQKPHPNYVQNDQHSIISMKQAISSLEVKSHLAEKHHPPPDLDYQSCSHSRKLELSQSNETHLQQHESVIRKQNKVISMKHRYQNNENIQQSPFQEQEFENSESNPRERLTKAFNDNFKIRIPKRTPPYISTESEKEEEDPQEGSPLPLKKRKRMLQVPYATGHAINKNVLPVMALTFEEEFQVVDYIVRIEHYQNRRFEFVCKNFHQYKEVTAAFVGFTHAGRKVSFNREIKRKLFA